MTWRDAHIAAMCSCRCPTGTPLRHADRVDLRAFLCDLASGLHYADVMAQTCSYTSARSPVAATAAWRKGRRSSSASPGPAGRPSGKRQGHRLTHRRGTTPAPKADCLPPRATAAQPKAADRHVIRCACRVMGCAEKSRQTRRCRRPRWHAVLGPDAREPAAGAEASWWRCSAASHAQISLVLLDQVCLKGRSDFVGRLERLIDGPFPRDVIHHVAIIPGTAPPPNGHRAIPAAMLAHAPGRA